MRKVKIEEFLTERKDRFKPDIANELGLKRIDKIDFNGNIHISDNKPTKTNMILIKQGDLVISGINVQKGAMSVYKEDEDLIATIHYSSYTYDKKQIDLEYLNWFLKSKIFIDILIEQTGSGIKTELKPKKFLKLEINLPILSKQKEIVKKLDNQISKQLNLETEFETQKHTIKKLKASLLNDAIKGKLTTQNENESAKDLIDNIKNENEKYFSQINENSMPFIIPTNWEWVRLEELTEKVRDITYGVVKAGKEEPENGTKLFRCSDIKFRYIDDTKVRTIDNDISLQYKRTILRGEEILINIRGTLGGCSIVDKKFEGYNIAREIAMIPLSNKVFNSFILNVMTSPYFENQIFGKLRGIAYKGLNLGLLRDFLIPLPPLEEQKRIVKKINTLFTKLDVLEKECESNIKYSDDLLQSILKEAFNDK